MAVKFVGRHSGVASACRSSGINAARSFTEKPSLSHVSFVLPTCVSPLVACIAEARGGMRPNNALWYWGLSFCISHCTLCLVVSVLLRLLLLLLLFLSSLCIGVFCALCISMTTMFLGPVLSIISSHCTFPLLYRRGSPAWLLQASVFFDSHTFLPLSHISVWRVSSLRSDKALANMLASCSESLVRRRVFGVECKDLGVGNDVSGLQHVV